ncbi:unnamed protein product [Paramecium pentaurelia]|uniref:Uncharacterized protein n=1 Tax=Paramecium pentaurelia TaxID=43138 RepID=A0A8S1Y515_9CILI|nr:unnamed protein product [Paramecium pentaurelia]
MIIIHLPQKQYQNSVRILRIYLSNIADNNENGMMIKITDLQKHSYLQKELLICVEVCVQQNAFKGNQNGFIFH